MRFKHKFTVDGTHYELTELDGVTGLVTLGHLGKMFGESIVRLLADVRMHWGEDVSSDILAGLVQQALANISPELLSNTMQTLLLSLCAGTADPHTQALHFGKPVNFETHFAGRYAHLIRVFVEAVRANYADFFDASRSARDPSLALAAAKQEAADAVQGR